ncbi:MAG: UDP-N-acetylmuramoyl-tripeptide--D-alanyl-D-alanine ligase [Betaproteobacteria bacterium]|nr:UDP-N-acetylmuramoyl-tripeptide--D-alanyl-D-alanine ligase [Betaproteobacteria bacterium]
MMALREAAAMVHGQLPAAAPSRTVMRVTTDSRSIQEGDLFVALKGERFDGHDFVADALAAGAAGALVDVAAGALSAGVGAYAPDTPCIAVRDPRLALGQLARGWRARFALPLIAVTGSNGKTTVTQMLASILREHAGPAAFHTEGNLNNDIGLPLTLLRLRPQHRIGVVELGMNHPGEIAYLAGIARPHIALVNNAQREHQEFMRSVADVAGENASVFDFLPHDGTAVVNADDAFAELFLDRAGGRPAMTFGMERAADVSGTPGDAAFGSHLHMRTPAGQAEVALRIAGRHNAMNALAAAAAALAAGVPLPMVARGLAAFVPVAGRLAKTMLPNGAIVLDDSYNANPDSVRAAIDVLHGIGGRRVLVLGRMAEVGEQGAAFHREVGAYARERGIDLLLTLGPETADAAQAFGPGGENAADIDAVTAAARAAAQPGTTLLVKGSRSAQMERVVRALTGRAAPAGGTH